LLYFMFKGKLLVQANVF